MFLLTLGFTEAKSNTSLFIYRRGDETAYLLLYVDDIVLTASSQRFATKDLGQLHHFLGVTVEPRPSGLLQQLQYALDILERAGMTDCKSCSTPVDTQAKLSADLGAPVADPTGVWPVPCSTLPSPGRTSPTLFSRSVSICMIPRSHTLLH